MVADNNIRSSGIGNDVAREVESPGRVHLRQCLSESPEEKACSVQRGIAIKESAKSEKRQPDKNKEARGEPGDQRAEHVVILEESKRRPGKSVNSVRNGQTSG